MFRVVFIYFFLCREGLRWKFSFTKTSLAFLIGVVAITGVLSVDGKVCTLGKFGSEICYYCFIINESKWRVVEIVSDVPIDEWTWPLCKDDAYA